MTEEIAYDDEFNIAFGELVWVAYHSWTDGATTEVDGYIDGPTKVQLDIASAGDEYVDVDDADAAKFAWADGGVYCAPATEGGVPTLIVPGGFLTRSLMREALRRFKP